MQKLRSTWLALMGGAFLVALSVSAAFGAPPTGTDGPRGQTVAAFVHELVFGADEETDADELINETEDEAAEEGSEEDEELAEELLVEDGEVFDSHSECVSAEASDKTDETAADANHGEVVSEAAHTCPTDEATEEVTEEVVEEETERVVPGEFANHGECVSDATDSADDPEASEAENKGEWVSDHARYICWSLPVPGEDAAQESSLEDETDAAELTAKEE